MQLDCSGSSCLKGQNPLHQFPRCKSVAIWRRQKSVYVSVVSRRFPNSITMTCCQQVGNFPVKGEVMRETCVMDFGHKKSNSSGDANAMQLFHHKEASCNLDASHRDRIRHRRRSHNIAPTSMELPSTYLFSLSCRLICIGSSTLSSDSILNKMLSKSVTLNNASDYRANGRTNRLGLWLVWRCSTCG